MISIDNDTPQRGRRTRRIWQEQRSADTRKAVMEAATKCLIEHGYSKTSVPLIAEIAGMSRGAILHHFPTRQDLLVTLVEELHLIRIREFRELFESLDRPNEPSESLAVHRRGVHAAWVHVNRPWYISYQELLSAARTEQGLWAVMAPLEKAYNKEFDQLLRELFPNWRDLEDFRLANDLTQFLLRGMMMTPIEEDREQRHEKILSKLAEVIDSLYLSER